MRTVKAEPLTAEAFRPFGDVIEVNDAARHFPINYGQTERYHDLAAIDCGADGGRVGVSLFRSTPVDGPITIRVMEYHPLSSQAFMPLGAYPYLVVVAPKGAFDAAKMRVFKAMPGQGVNYHPGTWHHFSLALEAVSDFLVIDRIGEGDNCVEHELTADEQVTVSL
ncbi:ureidoglycolate lyase [Kordiimonas marina]|uniref:ureidoglycolate lyase n=1 Tax=Kordiimonas marina TaxID=2872312 RepID=UPI001FF65019